ncbi:MAG: phosphatase PAP2 family protein [Chitinophagaceae bacterium]|nr:phosphatase PAP2 family protein [Chitinophagaceae bacterium]
MKKTTFLVTLIYCWSAAIAQIEPNAGKWKTWLIESGSTYRLSAPGSFKNEIADVLKTQKLLDSNGKQLILYWNAGNPGYRWQNMMTKLWMTDTSANGVLANMLLNVAIYDATIVAWDTKYSFNRPRPFAADKNIRSLIVKSESPSYPCEHSVAAGVAVAVISHFYPGLTDSVNKMAQQLIATRIAAGAAFPSDTRAGFELGKRIAQKEIERTADFNPNIVWDRKIPTETGKWNGKFAMLPLAGKNKTMVLTSGSQFRPGPPPDFAKEMAELKNYKQTFRSIANAYYFASPPAGDDPLTRKIFEYNLHLNPPRAARLNALSAIAMHDAFIACWDAKYAYWGIRPEQYDTTFRPLLFQSPPFPGYPSGHATVGGVQGELYSYFFPADKAYFQKRAIDGAESRFQGGIHFRTDNEVGLDMGRKIAALIIAKARMDGADAAFR